MSTNAGLKGGSSLRVVQLSTMLQFVPVQRVNVMGLQELQNSLAKRTQIAQEATGHGNQNSSPPHRQRYFRLHI
jgi:hypothetical protein